ncbi:Ig-like domain-containing protein [Moraxella bovis]|uniref:Ig-like domain-containing protein n=1 Tax=Moraxella bovis TaxID=476 RepID=UPI000DC7A926|nr:Ig-like domain-containing protein [Moraxella bovis]AWY19200.1 hypothetical protein DQF64_00775 [Moraxella bovis]UZA16479.1 Ig-like domain-containing protein [Moraxella bovis]
MKKAYRLIVNDNHNTKQVITLEQQKPIKLKARGKMSYQVVDEQNQPTDEVRVEQVGDDVYAYFADDELAFVIEDFGAYVSDFATSVAQTATDVSTIKAGTWLMGALAVGGVTALNKKSDAKTPNTERNEAEGVNKAEQEVKAKAEKEQAEKERLEKERQEREQAEKEQAEADELAKNPPKITFDGITDDNIINLSESQATLAVTGTVTNSKTGDVLTVMIGTASQTVVITDGKFSLNLDGKTLIIHNEISASLTRNGKDIGTTTHTYQVDTNIATPTISFNNITDDNVINLKESEGKISVSGTVENAKDGDEVTLSCGCPTCTGVAWVDIKTTIQNGTFSVAFDGSEMVASGRTVVKASVTTTDDAKNTATGTAEKSYGVDITPPDPSFVYEKIGKDGVINREVAKNHIVLKGKIANLGENETVAVKVSVNGKEHIATKNSDYYQVSIASGEFASGQAVKWHLTARDKAGNEKIIEQNQSYTYDVALNQPAVEIATNNQTVNSQSKGLTLSGSLNFDADVVQSSVKVDVILNNQTHSAMVNGKSWTVNLPENIAKQNQGNNDFVVKVSVQDNAGNVAENQSVGKFVVDTIAPDLMVGLDPISTIAQTGTDTVTLTGTVSGEFKPTDKVKVSVNGTEFTANVAQNGTFSVEVPRTALIQNASKSLSASLETSDTAGNIGTATVEQNYTVGAVVTPPNTPKPISIQLDSLTSDDVINVTESKIATTKITGTANGADGQMVTLRFGDKTATATVQNGKFSVDIRTQDLVENQSGKMVATLGSKTIERAYSVDNFASAQIKISEMAEINPSETVRLTGKIELTGRYAQYQNPTQFQSFVAKLNGKEYAIGINLKDQTFYWDISLADLQNAKGQEISFENKGGWSVYYLEDGKTRYELLPQLDKSAYQFNPNAYIENGAVKTNLPNPQTLIKGVVLGSAKVGDTITLDIGNERIETQVKDDLSFETLVDNGILKQSDKVVATLTGKNHQGQTIVVNTEHAYKTGKDNLTGDFVSTFEHSNSEKPYFIQSLEYRDQASGYLKNWQIGKGATISYSFNNEYSNALDWTEGNRKAVRDALDTYEKYADIKFVQIDDNAGVNTTNGEGRADIGFHHRPLSGSAGVGYYGGNVHFSVNHPELGVFLIMHEVGHSLGMKHTHENPTLSYFEEHTGMSVMSYKTTNMEINRSDLRLFDIAFVQYRYGVNKTQRAGNDTYTFKTFNPQSPDGNIYIWDGAGVDTFDASKENERVTVDLTAGSWIYRGDKAERLAIQDFKNFTPSTYFTGYDGAVTDNWRLFNGKVGDYTFTDGQAFIGYGTQLERLIGSEYSDSLKGNVADNEIFGGNGDDLIEGRDGNDYLDGGRGNDTIHGGKGDDIFVVDNANDVVVENYLEGIDTVHSYAQSYTLSPNVENISLFGVAEIAIGNDLDNRITGNELSNTLTGGAGADTFVFSNLLNGSVDTITDFNVNEDSIALALRVFDNLTADNIKEHIKYDSQTGALSYDKDGADVADAVVFATLDKGLDENLIVYQVI